MDRFVMVLLGGISYGMLLFMIAAGFSLVFGVMRIFNLAHGALYMLGAYVGLTVVRLGVNFWWAALAGGIGAVLVGLLLERGFLSRLYKQVNEQVLLTVGFVYIIGNLVLWVWGPNPMVGAPPTWVSGFIMIGDFTFPYYRLLFILIGLAIAIGLWWLQERTRVGAIVRASMDDKEMTICLGVNFGPVASGVFLLGAFLGGFAGFLGTPMVATNSSMAFQIVILAFILVVVGGVGSIQGALLGGILIGIIDSFGKVFFPDLAMFTVYFGMIVMLLIRPTGLLGRRI
jgi:branched-chain amino acid transport system permease protein